MRRWLLLLLIAAFAVAVPVSGTALATTPPEPTPLQTTPPMEHDVTECISALPPPGCGFAPQQAGDRGGWMQWTLFSMMLVALAFIGWRVVVGLRRAPAHDA